MRLVIAGDFPVAVVSQPRHLVGGIQAVIYHTLQGLLNYPDLEIHVVACEKSIPDVATQTLVAMAATPDAAPAPMAHYLPSPPRLPHTLSMLTVDRQRLAHTLRRLRPDVVHAHGQAAAYPWAAFDSGAPTIVTVHGINQLEAAIDRRGGALRGWLRQFIWGQIEASCLRRAQDIVVISPFVAEVIRPHTRARLHAIENPIEPRLLDRPRRPLTPPRILYVGSIQKRKGLVDLIQALGQVRQRYGNDAGPILRVAGAFMEPYAAYGEEVRRVTAALGLTPYVHFLGHLDRTALLEEYTACTLFCLPSYLEASPVVVAEAMAAGCPVVVAAIPSTEHLVVDGQTGRRVAPGDVDGLAEAILTLLERPALGKAWGEAARRVARERFSPQEAAAASYKLYRQVANTTHSRMRSTHG